jgi:hypothetical protein
MQWCREDAYIIHSEKLVLKMLNDEALISKCIVKSCLNDSKDVIESRVSFGVHEYGARMVVRTCRW